MKKVVFGALVFLAGLLSAALLLAGSMSNDWTLNGEQSAWWNLSRYGLVPFFFVCAAIGVAGLIVAVIGLFDKKE